MKNSRNAIPKYEHIIAPHVSSISIPLYQNCIGSRVLISLNVMWNIRNEADKIFVRTKYIDCLICKISIRVHGMICSITLGRL